MITKEAWDSLTPTDKLAVLSAFIQPLHEIRSGTHPLIGKREQGRLAQVKKDAETDVLNIIEWETIRDLAEAPAQPKTIE